MLFFVHKFQTTRLTYANRCVLIGFNFTKKEKLMNKRTFVTDIILLGLSVLLTIGSFTFMAPCGPHEDGSFMACHWAGRAVLGLGMVLVAMSIVHIITGNNSVKTGISVGLISVSVLSALIPGIFINICKMDTMRCVSVMRPVDMIISFVITGVAVVDIAVQQSKKRA